MTNANFATVATANLNEMFIANAYRKDLIGSFNSSNQMQITNGQRTFGMKLVFRMYHLFTSEVRRHVRGQEEAEPIQFQVSMMGQDGRGKIRYIGCWAISH